MATPVNRLGDRGDGRAAAAGVERLRFSLYYFLGGSSERSQSEGLFGGDVTMRQPVYILGFLLGILSGPRLSAQEKKPDFSFFETKIRPVLIDNCYKCHSAEAQKNKKLRGNLLLDSRAGVLKGGDNGPAVVPGKPKQSLLLKAIRHEGPKMPQDKKL